VSLACPACGGGRWEPLFERDGHAYVACATCGTARLDPLPEAAAAEAHYDLGYFEGGTAGGYLDYDAEAPAREANATAVVARLAALHPARGRLLEVGCASGWLLAAAAADGWEVCGVEVNAEMRNRAQARVPDALLWPSLADVDAPPAAFDAVACIQVLEHIVDPAAVLDQLAELTRPGGSVVVESWDRSSAVARALGARWQQVTPPSVLWLFTRTGLGRMLARHGWEAPVVKASAKRVGIGSVLELAAGKAGRAGRLLRRPLEVDRIRRATVPYALGDLVTSVAQRR
jgi:SAM-dependent methyltransferase